MIQSYVRDVAIRALHTFWQTFSASLLVVWAGSGLNVADLVHISAWHKLAVAVIAAAGAAALSTVKSLAVGGKSGDLEGDGDVPALESDDVDQGVDAATPQATPADPEQPAAGVPPAASEPMPAAVPAAAPAETSVAPSA